jgi:GTP-binding protein
MGSDMFEPKATTSSNLKMPVGTILTDAETGEVLLPEPGEQILTLAATVSSFGNLRFKSLDQPCASVPRRQMGERKSLKLDEYWQMSVS